MKVYYDEDEFYPYILLEKEPRKGWRGPVDVPEDVARTYIETEKAFQSAHDALMEYIGW